MLKGRLVRYLHHGIEFLGVLVEDGAQGGRYGLGANLIAPLDTTNDMMEFIINFERLGGIKPGAPQVSLDEVKLLAPIKSPLQDPICLGLNYLDHAKESMRFKGEKDSKLENPVYFSKRVGVFSDPNSVFSKGRLTSQLDYEVELVVIIGRDCRFVSHSEAMDYVFGYSIGNDLSARDIQLKHKQWYAGKSLEGSFPLGPCIVLRDSLDAHNLTIKSFVNGELRQHSSTANLIFDIPTVISELSGYFTLRAGTVISMGTPSGVGMGFVPPRFLEVGDVVSCEIEGIGILDTRIES